LARPIRLFAGLCSSRKDRHLNLAAIVGSPSRSSGLVLEIARHIDGNPLRDWRRTGLAHRVSRNVLVLSIGRRDFFRKTDDLPVIFDRTRQDQKLVASPAHRRDQYVGLVKSAARVLHCLRPTDPRAATRTPISRHCEFDLSGRSRHVNLELVASDNDSSCLQ